MKRFFAVLCIVLLWASVGWGNDKTVVIGDTASFTFTYTSAIDSAQLILIRGAVADTFSLMPIAGSSHKGCDWEGLFNQVDSAGSYLVWIEAYSGGAIIDTVLGSCYVELAVREANMVQLSDDAGAADNLENMVDGDSTTLAKLTLSQLWIKASGNDYALAAYGAGTGHGGFFQGGAGGHGVYGIGGSTSGDGSRFTATTSGYGMYLYAAGNGKAALAAFGGASQNVGAWFAGGQTGGHAFNITATAGNGVAISRGGGSYFDVFLDGSGSIQFVGAQTINATMDRVTFVDSVDTLIKPVSATATVDTESVARAVWDNDIVAQANRTVTASCAGTGTDTLDLYIFDADTTAVEGVTITVWNKGRTATVVPGINTDVNGKVQLGLSADTFHVWLHRLGVIYSEWDTVVVPSGGGIDTIWVTAYDVGSPPSGNVTRIKGFTRTFAYQTTDRVTVTFQAQEGNLIDTSTNVFLDKIEVYTYSDTGYFEIDLIPSINLLSKRQNATDKDSVRYDVRMWAPGRRLFEWQGILVPDSSGAVWLKDLIE